MTLLNLRDGGFCGECGRCDRCGQPFDPKHHDCRARDPFPLLDADPHGGNPDRRYSPAPDVEGGMEPDRFGAWVLAGDAERLRSIMQRCADKLEMFGNEEPREVAKVLRETAGR